MGEYISKKDECFIREIKERMINAENLNKEEAGDFAYMVWRSECYLTDVLTQASWVPVSEWLPDEGVNPITNDAYVYPVTVQLSDGTRDVRYYSFHNGHWYNKSPWEMDGLVVAWQPLPKPWGGKE